MQLALQTCDRGFRQRAPSRAFSSHFILLPMRSSGKRAANLGYPLSALPW
jgi:hypothetical protein